MKKKNYVKPKIREHIPVTPFICQEVTGSANGQSNGSGSNWGVNSKMRIDPYAQNDDGSGFYQSYNNSDESLW